MDYSTATLNDVIKYNGTNLEFSAVWGGSYTWVSGQVLIDDLEKQANQYLILMGDDTPTGNVVFSTIKEFHLNPTFNPSLANNVNINSMCIINNIDGDK